jgi:hypothetical protein
VFRPTINKNLHVPGLAAWLIVFSAFVLEILLFNGQSLALIGRRTETRSVTAANFRLTGFTIDPNEPALLKPDANIEHSIEIQDINLDVETLWLDVTSQNKPVIRCQVYATDAAASNYYKALDDYLLVDDLTRSRYVRLHLDGASAKIKITFDLKAGQDLKLSAITLNQPIPMDFSLIRFSLLSALGLLSLFVSRSAICQDRRYPGNRWQRALLILVGTIVLLTSVVIAAAAAGGKMASLAAVNGDIYSRDLTNALSAGHLHLLIEPPQALASLANPYDSGLRAASGIKDVLWDVAYYQGRYYVYFGVVPALLLFVPFHLLTGLYLPSVWAVILFSLVGLIFLSRLLDQVLYYFFPSLPFRFYLLSTLTLAAGSNLWWCLARPKFYEVAITGGFCLGMIGLYLLFRCWQDRQDGLQKTFRLAAGCLCLALAVGCRPNLLVLSLLPLPLFWQCLRQPVPLPAGLPMVRPRRSVRWLALIRNLLAIGMPYLVTSSALMAYNFLRFGKITEFGASYQLTITDMGIRGALAPARLLPGFWYFLFNFPVLDTSFPFIHFQTDNAFNFSGYFYTDMRCAGLLVTLPICWLLLGWPWLRPVLRHSDRQLRFLLAMLCGTALMLAGIDSMAAGSTGRYLTDFAWLLVLAAILLAAAVTTAAAKAGKSGVNNGETLIPDGSLLKTVLPVYSLICGLTILTALLLGLQGENNLFLTNNPSLYYQLERLVAFWLP